MRWDIFCQIVDNYGDAGVCWRLARSLSHGSIDGDDIRIRLFCDDLNVLDQIAHGNARLHGLALGIEVLPWDSAKTILPNDIGDVVIEAFACQIPQAYIDNMLAAPKPPIWINLEYLTAEPWADDMHLLPSPQNNGLPKYFYFPGFTEKTGGVTLGDWDKVSSRTDVPESLLSAWAQCRPHSHKISIFNYPHAPLEAWLISLDKAADGKPVDVMVCAQQNISTAFFKRSFTSLQLIQLPFIPQEDYDWLLAHCDFNLVRGEDSFVRAQWAGKPFIWDIYPQEDMAHEIKLAAFLSLYFEKTSTALNSSCRAAMNWEAPTVWWSNLPAWKDHSEIWAKKLRALGTLEGKILDFVKSQEISR